jgi:hypothetical protein
MPFTYKASISDSEIPILEQLYGFPFPEKHNWIFTRLGGLHEVRFRMPIPITYLSGESSDDLLQNFPSMHDHKQQFLYRDGIITFAAEFGVDLEDLDFTHFVPFAIFGDGAGYVSLRGKNEGTVLYHDNSDFGFAILSRDVLTWASAILATDPTLCELIPTTEESYET